MTSPRKSVARFLVLGFVIVASFSQLECSRAHRNESVSVISTEQSADALNINSATVDELENLPGIGKTLAGRIVDFREKSGPFRRAENLLLVDGLSEKKFRQIRPLIKIE